MSWAGFLSSTSIPVTVSVSIDNSNTAKKENLMNISLPVSSLKVKSAGKV
jgi:hypothetical protein